MEQKLEDILEKVDQLQPHEQQIVLKHLLDKYGQADAMVVGSNYNFWRNSEDDAYDKFTGNGKEDGMPAVQEQLAIANEKVNSRIDDIWSQASENLKKLEAEYHRQKEEEHKP